MAIDKTSLHEKLQNAAQLELATIPPYLTAVFSLHENANRESAGAIRSVYMEEMLHMVLAANVLTATGGAIKLGQDNIPSYPLNMQFNGKKFRDRQFDVNLARFSKESIDTFRKIELPDWRERNIGLEEFTRIEVDGFTIGEFYQSIQEDLSILCDESSESEVFSGKKEHQITEEYYWGGQGKPIVVHNLQTAIEAIDLIIEQGEGADGTRFGDDEFFGQPDEIAHYFRFNEIFHQRRYKESDPIQADPTGEPMDVDFDAVYPIKSNCKHTDFAHNKLLSDLNEEFNQHYSLMLRQLEEAFTGNPKVLYTAITNGMYALSPLAFKMVKLPIAGGQDGVNGAPSFEWMDPIT